MPGDIAQSSLIQTRNELHHRMVNLCETLLAHDALVSRAKSALAQAIDNREVARKLLDECEDDAKQIEAVFLKLTGRKMPRNNITREPSP